MLAGRTDDLSSIPGAHMVEGRTGSYKSSFDLHMGAMEFTYIHIHTQIRKYLHSENTETQILQNNI